MDKLGFRKKCSPQAATIKLINSITNNAAGKFIVVIFLDSKKAFDKINHSKEVRVFWCEE